MGPKDCTTCRHFAQFLGREHGICKVTVPPWAYRDAEVVVHPTAGWNCKLHDEAAGVTTGAIEPNIGWLEEDKGKGEPLPARRPTAP